MLCAVPTLRALRRAFPSACIALVGLQSARELAERLTAYVDAFMPFSGHSALPEAPATGSDTAAFVAAVRARRFDLALQLHGRGDVTTPLVASFGAVRTAGFVGPDMDGWDARWFAPYPESGREPERLLALLDHLGIARAGTHLELPVADADRAALRAAAGELPRPYACIHPGAAWESRRWAPERFGAVADGLAARGLHVVLTGSAGERSLTGAVRRSMRAPAIDLAGRTTLGTLAALVADAALVVCNDTGISHVAAALRTPSVVVVTGSDPDRWAPADATRHRVVRRPVPCSPCLHSTCPIDHPCARRVAPGAVLAAAERALAGADRRAA